MAQLEHPFVRALADGSLDEERFASYVGQDYAFLADYGRALRRAAALAPTAEARERLETVAGDAAESELELHRGYAAGHGLDLDAVEPLPTTRAYGSYLCAQESFPVLVAALLPCMWGYAELGRRLAELPTAPRFARWLETYADPEFARVAGWCVELARACAADEAVRPAMRQAFETSLRFETAFWDAAWARKS
ncbi:MAG TPA: hypothetical protein VF186_09945 [Gaiellaceae bacterium]